MPSPGQVLELLRVQHTFDRLGNKSNPLDELIYIMLSAQTTGKSYNRVYQQFRREFYPWAKLIASSERKIISALTSAGLGTQRGTALKRIVEILETMFGKPTMAPLRKWDRCDAEAFLIGLPRIGIKSARCILGYSLGHDVMPLDTHCYRVLSRLQLLNGYRKDGQKAHDRANSLFPDGSRLEAHVLLVKHGRTICRAPRPLCGRCALVRLCPHGRRVNTSKGSTR